MTAGVDVSEAPAKRVLALHRHLADVPPPSPTPGFVHDHRSVDYTPGTKGVYRSVDAGSWA